MKQKVKTDFCFYRFRNWRTYVKY